MIGRRAAQIAFGLAMLGVLGGAIAAAVAVKNSQARSCCSGADKPDQVPVLYDVPAFSLTSSNRQTVTRETFDGRPWVVDFIFTRCPGPCPIMSGRMATLQKKLDDLPDLRYVTITVDPKYDTPEVLQDYARRFRADPARWLFLTGDAQAIYDLSINGFKLGAPKGAVIGDLITHSQKFVLVDRSGRVRGYYDGTDTEEMDKLQAAARRVYGEKAASRAATMTGEAN